MATSRRSFLTNTASFSILPLALRTEGLGSDVNPANRSAGEQYWSSIYKEGGVRSQKVIFGNEMRDPRFAFFDAKTGFRWVEDNKIDDLPTFNEDAVVTLELAGFR